jgi:hypothetical protein
MNPNAEAAFEDGQVFRARVIDQTLAKNHNDEPQLVLTVKLLARLKDPQNPADGAEECPQLEREVRISFVADDEERLRMAARDLERLGYTDDDISRLHPDHPDHFSLMDKEVHVRMKEVGDFQYWNLAWPRERPRPVAVEEAKSGAAALKEKLAAVKRRAKERQEGKKKGQGRTGGATPPEVPY